MSEGVRPTRPHEWAKLGLTRPPSDARFTPDTSSQDTDDIRMDYLRADTLHAHFCNCAGQFVTVLQPDRGAVAALLLQLAGPDGKPLLTRADAQLIRDALSRWDGMADTDEGTIEYVGNRYPLEQRRSLADRLGSLLPPEEP